jgi:membrane peptidoglycan carboxypeptidase
MRDANGNIVMGSEREVRRRPISRETARAMTHMLQAVVEDEGTGVLAASLEYPVAGKTGTAQKPSPRGGYLKDKYLASFIGFAPADDPRIVVYVGLDEPKGYYYGGQVAAPIFREVVEKTLRYLKVPSRRRLIASDADEGGGEAYARALPATPRESPRVVPLGDGTWQLPDFTGLTMRGVASAAGDAAITLRFIGSGVAVSQSPSPGSMIREGQECAVEFRSTL